MQAYLIDSSIYIFRSYFTLPENWQALDSGHSTHAVYGFTAFLLDMLRNKNPEHLFCAFDESLRSGFRHQLCPDYKANRELPDEALAFQLNACRQLCRVLGVAEMASETYEADDLIGAVAKNTRLANAQPVVVTRDKDLMQLIEAEDLFWDFGKAAPKTQRQVERDLEIGCQQMADFLALTGDSSDNIAGVPGVGAKTAKQLLLHFPDIDAILDHLDQLQDLPIRGASKLADKIDNHREQLLLARQLTTIYTDIKDAPSLEQIAWQGINLDAFDLFCEEMGFAGKFHDRAKQLRRRQLAPSWLSH
ncbi:flap endonuclease [SAR92 clade bacterium H455]|uniref:Flap endonuclease n=1 Tax=SAR92 clade bacterium H455 TaxID=2974818 RepID=A0ABY5TN91_9GAMM|nr:flap endonuclease [SAR92 clade bacterium H455]